MSTDASSAYGSGQELHHYPLPITEKQGYSQTEHQNSRFSETTTDTLPHTDIPFNTSTFSSSYTQLNSARSVDPLHVYPAKAESTFGWKLRAQLGQTLSDQVTPVRLVGHLSVVVVAALILILSQVQMPEWDFSLRALPSLSESDNSLTNGLSMQLPNPISRQGDASSVLQGSSAFLQQAPVPFTIIQERGNAEEQIESYIVQSGDTVLDIAKKFGLRPETIQWANSGLELNPDLIRPGDQLIILPFDGALHIVQPGDTLSSIATKYRISVEDIVGYAGNEVADADAAISIGTPLVLPGGTKPFVAPQVVAYDGRVPTNASRGTGAFGWPTGGAVSQGFWGGHRALDIGAWTGAPVQAADSGYVAIAASGWNTGYGNYIIVDHGNGFVTLYAHLNSIFVRQGESIAKGQQIGSVGNTGNSTGPHLHFEIRYQGVQRNPFSYLP